MSAPSKETFVIVDAAINDKNLVVSEFMYRPSQETGEEEALGYTDRDDFEFIELLNIGNNLFHFLVHLLLTVLTLILKMRVSR